MYDIISCGKRGFWRIILFFGLMIILFTATDLTPSIIFISGPIITFE
jgi:hypothetical protein